MAVLAEAVEKRDPRTRRLWFDVTTVVDRNIAPANAALVAKRIRQVGVDRVLYGSDAAIGDNPASRGLGGVPPAAAHGTRVRAVARNEAPYFR